MNLFILVPNTCALYTHFIFTPFTLMLYFFATRCMQFYLNYANANLYLHFYLSIHIAWHDVL